MEKIHTTDSGASVSLSPNFSAPTSSPTASTPTQTRESKAVEFKLNVFENNAIQIVQAISTEEIEVPEHLCRHSSDYASAEYAELVQSILRSGTNVTPIVVKRVYQGRGKRKRVVKYVVIAGGRRVRACKDAGLRVRAIICDLEGEHAFYASLRDNQNAVKLSPWSLGKMAKFGLDNGFFRSQRHAGQELQRNEKDINSAIQVASLPDYLIAPFVSADQLGFHYGPALMRALKSDAAAVNVEAQRILSLAERPSRKLILELLCAAGGVSVGRSNAKSTAAPSLDVGPSNAAQNSLDIVCGGTVVGRVLHNLDGRTQVVFDVPLSDEIRLKVASGVAAVLSPFTEEK